MQLHSHISSVPAQVRRGEFLRDRVASFARESAFAIASGIGPPRLWSYATKAALDGFALGFANAEEAPAAERLAHAMNVSRIELSRACERLVERTVPDASLTALFIDEGCIYVVAAGASRVYVRRVGSPKRLTPRDEVRGGLIYAQSIRSELELRTGDIVLAGTPAAFSDRAVGRLSTVLDDAPQTDPSVLAALLTDPPSKAGIAAAAVAVRVV